MHARVEVSRVNVTYIHILYLISNLAEDCHLLGHDKTSSVAYNQAKVKLAIIFFSRDRLWRNPRKRVCRWRNLF